MNILIVEDEELAVRKLQKLLTEVDPSLTIVGVTNSIEDTVAWLGEYDSTHPSKPDLIFMDIELADGQSFEIFDQVEVYSTVIFTTSYDEYALQAFKVNSIDYLLKPIQKEDLQRSLKKFQDLKTSMTQAGTETNVTLNVDKLLRELQLQSAKDYRKRFLVRQGQRYLSIETSEIAYFFTDERYSFFVTHTNQKFLVDYTLDEISQSLDPAHFFRINRAMLVTHKSVDQIQPYFGNRLSLVLKPILDKEILVSREKVQDFKKWMGK
ncbi:LytTR family DNA-binding domain-containing protein [Cytophagaceae bacterium DM2B3-1]|uniref:LytTR family DNA-binding domain-containing protein n=1 Tax=Xanthocytophaga flava TaxID=3048013 RepID=A0AAE3QRL2_9BACT|nr:LytTR family DNA-binding domain-containing protein [Xanthocytophaga flavus]MDJ1472456.1 LytTR family DNA-binding domain-containing protein [Xanthocytophaga flavus]MDJ1483651.1 LytTR family DNA-binding domain-containing protein [Xanthocytophaga flavus]MDJ1497822.1 LytTR family DNA-binding domain-containing protein [Xanthocytophaga flavus]